MTLILLVNDYMKKLTILSLAAAMAAGFASTASAQSGTITFNGEVIATTCSVTFPGGTGVGNDATYQLRQVTASTLANVGDRANRTPITLQIGGTGGQCSSGTASLELNPNRNAAVDGTYLRNTAATSPATNVAIALSDGNDVAIDISRPWASAPIDLAATKDLRFGAEYVATGAAAAGNVTAAVGYTVTYR